jgi:hypothetical protein
VQVLLVQDLAFAHERGQKVKNLKLQYCLER